MYFLYSLLFTFGLILSAPYYLWRLRGNLGKGAGWRERFGLMPGENSATGSGPGSIWVHAVSVGETLAVLPLVKELKRLYPDRKIFLSHVTPAGKQTSEAKLPDVAGRFFLPLDWGWAVKKTIARVQPALLVIVETELWPNLLRSAHRSGARVALVNARLSERSFRGYRMARPLMKRVLENIDWIGAQSAADAERFRKLGAVPERVEVAGNVKFDSARTPNPGFPIPESRFPVFVAASTMAGEEELLLPVWNVIRQKHPKALMILAPRHPARFDAVAQILTERGVTFARRTELKDRDSRGGGNSDGFGEVLLLDTIGELAGVFALADLVFMGGSLVPTGGHNLLEPAFWGKATIFGPHMQNFRDVAALFLNACAAVQVTDANELAAAALELLDDEPRRKQLGRAAKQVLESQAGATERILNHFAQWLGETPARWAAERGEQNLTPAHGSRTR
jgi:3-deoxy-D-manno-octulosonic-acid transferase